MAGRKRDEPLITDLVNDALDKTTSFPRDREQLGLCGDLIELRELLWDLYQTFDLASLDSGANYSDDLS